MSNKSNTKTNLAKYFDSVDFGFDLSGDWKKDEAEIYRGIVQRGLQTGCW